MKWYLDTENNTIISEKELVKEFAELKNSDPETYDYTFAEYVINCTSKNGFLKEMR